MCGLNRSAFRSTMLSAMAFPAQKHRADILNIDVVAVILSWYGVYLTNVLLNAIRQGKIAK